MLEEWKEYPFDTRYLVSNFGKVKGQKGQLLKGSLTNAGYQRIGLYTDGKGIFKFVHRMVMETFSPCENMDKLEVNHKDGNKLNNKLDNLEWCTRNENIYHSVHVLKNIPQNLDNLHENNKKQVQTINKNTKEIKVFNSLNETADFYNVKYQTIQYYLKTKKLWKKQNIFISYLDK